MRWFAIGMTAAAATLWIDSGVPFGHAFWGGAVGFAAGLIVGVLHKNSQLATTD